jgi:DNA-binding CsgD family transcriptional regulator/PAS domain-containing protein
MPSTSHLLRLVAQIYDAAADQRLWPGVVTGLTQAVGGYSAALELRDLARLTTAVTASYNVPNIQAYQEQFGGPKNILIQRGAPQLLEGRCVTSDMLCPASDLLSSDFYNEFLRPQDMFHVMGGIIIRQQSRSAIVSMTRPRRVRNFGVVEREFLHKLLPHLKRALQFHTRMALMESERENMASVLDGVPFGIVFISAERKLAYVNSTAEQFLSTSDGISLSRNGIEIRDPHCAAEFRRLLTGALQTAQGKGLESGGALRVVRPSGARDYWMLVCPSTTGVDLDGQVGAVVFITDPDKVHECPAEILAQIFGLTPAESRLMRTLAEGGTLSEVADQLGISRNTAHVQLMAIYQKTGTRRQTDLLRLVFSAPRAIKKR